MLKPGITARGWGPGEGGLHMSMGRPAGIPRGREWAAAQPQLMAYARWATGSREEAEDLVQAVAVRAWRGFAHFRGDAAFLTWTMAIARREAARAGARRQRLLSGALSSLRASRGRSPGLRGAGRGRRGPSRAAGVPSAVDRPSRRRVRSGRPRCDGEGSCGTVVLHDGHGQRLRPRPRCATPRGSPRRPAFGPAGGSVGGTPVLRCGAGGFRSARSWSRRRGR